MIVNIFEGNEDSCERQVSNSMSGNDCADSLCDSLGSVGFLTVKECEILQMEQCKYKYL